MSKSEILPTEQHRLIGLVKAAGIDVRDWANGKGGRKKAASNPKYCYEWAFVQPKEFILLNLWHASMEEADGVVFTKITPRNLASERTGIERSRALRMDKALQTAVKGRLPVRVVVLEGRRRKNMQEKPSHVTARLLDPVSWTVTTYDSKTGDCILTRGVHRFADQFSTPDETDQKPEQRDVSGRAFVRSSTVRSNALSRANGKCEWCGNPGFVMADGRTYLETHHVIPLSEDGRDTERNVAALCPNHHREAHHGANRADMRQKLLQSEGSTPDT